MQFGKGLTFLLGGFLFSTFGFAQEMATEEKKSEYAETMTVTAEKREESPLEVAQSLSVLDSDRLEDAGIADINEASFRIPNLFISAFSARRTSFPFIRGLGSGLGEPAVTTYIDGVPQLTANTSNLEFLDIDRIEVLRGPQGTLYGRNTLGGLIQIVTQDPENHWQGRVQTELGDFGNWRQQVSGSGPLGTENVLFDAGVSFFQRDGFTDDQFRRTDADDRDSFYGKANLVFLPSKSWRIKVGAYSQKDRDGGFVLYDLASIRRQPHEIRNDYEGAADRDLIAPSLTVQHFGSRVDFNGVLAYEDWDAEDLSDLDFSEFDLLKRQVMEEQQQTYLEARFSSAQGADLSLAGNASLRWMAGVSAFDAQFENATSNEFRPGITMQPFPLFETSNYQLDDRGFALFGQADILFAESWEATVGLRYLDETKEGDYNNTSQTLPPPLNSAAGSIDNGYDSVLPRVGLAFRPGNAFMTYFNAAKGFRSGGFNRNTGTVGGYEFDPETSWTYELGVKLHSQDNRLYGSASVFQIDWRDRQLEVPISTVPGRFFLDNVGDAESRGFEVEGGYWINRQWRADAGFGWTEAEFDQYFDPNSQSEVGGNQLPNVPETTWNFSLGYDNGPADGVRFFGHADVVGIGKMYFDNANAAAESSYAIANFRAGIRWRGLRVAAWVKNAFDEVYVPIAIPSFFSQSGYVGRNGDPRTAGITLSYDF